MPPSWALAAGSWGMAQSHPPKHNSESPAGRERLRSASPASQFTVGRGCRAVVAVQGHSAREGSGGHSGKARTHERGLWMPRQGQSSPACVSGPRVSPSNLSFHSREQGEEPLPAGLLEAEWYGGQSVLRTVGVSSSPGGQAGRQLRCLTLCPGRGAASRFALDSHRS